MQPSRDDEANAAQSSEDERNEQSRIAVVRTLKADVASLFANIRRAKEAVLRTDAAET